MANENCDPTVGGTFLLHCYIGRISSLAFPGVMAFLVVCPIAACSLLSALPLRCRRLMEALVYWAAFRWGILILWIVLCNTLSGVLLLLEILCFIIRSDFFCRCFWSFALFHPRRDRMLTKNLLALSSRLCLSEALTELLGRYMYYPVLTPKATRAQLLMSKIL